MITASLFFSVSSFSFPPEVMHTVPQPLSLASLYSESISAVFPEYEFTITRVFFPAHAGSFWTLRRTIGTEEIGENKSVAMEPTIPDPPIPPMIISLYLRKIGCFEVASEFITLLRLVRGLSTKIKLVCTLPCIGCS